MKADMRQFERQSIAVAWRSKRVWTLQFFGNALLMAAFDGWLRIPDRHGWQFALTVTSGLIIIIAALWLHTTTLALFRAAHQEGNAKIGGALSPILPRLVAFAVWAAIFSALLWIVAWAWDYNLQLAGWVRHVLPGFLRSHVSPHQVAVVGSWKFRIFFWIIVPIVLLPLGSQVAARGFAGFAESSSLGGLRRVRYWIAYLALLGLGVCLPERLMAWVPKLEGISQQAVSMGVRFAIAYLLTITAWVLLASALGRLGRTKDDKNSGLAGEVGVREPVPSSPPGRHRGAETDLT